MLQRPEERNPWQPGLHRTIQPHDVMMMMLKFHESITLDLLSFTALKLFVHHVVL